jgi:ectoine hydroxylase-related dioxygenase (phytanoyl-CoA dioxygenase family)
MSNTPQLLPLVWENTDLDSIVDIFERDGIVVLKGMFPEHWVSAADRVADRLLTQLDERPWAAGEEYCQRFDIWTKIFGNLESDPDVLVLFENEVIQTVTNKLARIGSTAGSIGSWVTSGGCGQAWHQDSWSSAPNLFILNRIVFTRNYTPEHGQLLVVPGSHRYGDLPTGDPYESLPNQVAFTLSANTAVFLHSRTYHCVTKNATNEPRIQFNRRVVPNGVPADLTSRARFRNGTWDFSIQSPW